MYYTTDYKSPIGDLILASSAKGLMGLWIKGQKYECMTLPKNNVKTDNDSPVLIQAKNWLKDYFEGMKPLISTLPLDPIGTEFQKTVWDILIKIPYGQVTTYNEIAKEIATKEEISRMSAQAVGGAVGHNQISIIIPCHRVIGSNGSLTGYAGGIDRKIRLLTHEGVNFSKK